MSQIRREHLHVPVNRIFMGGPKPFQKTDTVLTELQIRFLNNIIHCMGRHFAPLMGNTNNDARNQCVKSTDEFRPRRFLTRTQALENERFR